jgi:ATP-dependent Lon protease
MSGHIPLPATPIDLPLLPLRDVVVFPHMVIPLFVGRPKSIKALEAAMETERRIMLVAQKAAAQDDPLVSDMFDVGCVATILQMLKLPDGTVKVLVEGHQRAVVNKIEEGESHFSANVTPAALSSDLSEKSKGKASEVEALRRAVMQQFDQYVKLNKKIPPEILTSISSIDDPGRLADTIAAHLPLKLESKQAVLSLSSVKERLENLFQQIEREVDILNVDKKIRGRVKRQMSKSKLFRKNWARAKMARTSKRLKRRSRLQRCRKRRLKRQRQNLKSSSSCRPCRLRRRWFATTLMSWWVCLGLRRQRSSTTWPTPKSC